MTVAGMASSLALAPLLLLLLLLLLFLLLLLLLLFQTMMIAFQFRFLLATELLSGAALATCLRMASRLSTAQFASILEGHIQSRHFPSSSPFSSSPLPPLPPPPPPFSPPRNRCNWLTPTLPTTIPLPIVSTTNLHTYISLQKSNRYESVQKALLYSALRYRPRLRNVSVCVPVSTLR